VRSRLADLDVESRDDLVVAHVAGEIDSSNATELRIAILDALSNSVRAVVLDLTSVSYLDSTAIALIFDLARGLESRRQGLRLSVAGDGPARRVLELCRIDAVAPLDEDPEAAIAALGGTGADRGRGPDGEI
jgi:anti-sigma B factor antagonist